MARTSARAQQNQQAGQGAQDDGAPKDARKKQILKAAVKVFAEKGYHGCRISDVAEEAGVAYGLVYHYFGNKDGLLAAVFDTNWGFFAKAIDDIAAQPQLDMEQKLTQIVELTFEAYRLAPLTVKVLVLEFGRNARLGEALENDHVARVFRSIARIFDEGKKANQLLPGIDPVAMSVLFMGALETCFVSFVLEHAPGKNSKKLHAAVSLDAMKTTLMAILHRGALAPSAKREK